MIKYFTRLESCNPSICRNNGKCRLGVPPTCLCQAPYSGEFCQISKSNFFNTVHHGKDATYLFPRYFLIERHFHSWLHIFLLIFLDVRPWTPRKWILGVGTHGFGSMVDCIVFLSLFFNTRKLRVHIELIEQGHTNELF